MNFIEEFIARGFFHQCTNLEALTEQVKNNKITAYIGFDCTAKSLHIGSLMQLMIFRLLQKYGHKSIVIMGGGTTKIGDPSGKDDMRKMLTDEDIQENMDGIKSVIEKFVTFGRRSNDAIMVNNADWLTSMNYLDFLRDCGRYFSVNRMLTFDNVKLRLEREQNLSFLEFNYMLLQAYDFVELKNRYNCTLQIGGSDQWGNIVNGVDLYRKKGGEGEIYGLTTPLMTTASGQKMGKTHAGAVWLSEELLSSYDYYQYWRNVDDADVIRFLKIYTDLSIAEIEKLSDLQGQELNEAKKILAFEATKICHGEEKALNAQETAIKLFEQGLLGGDLPECYIENATLQAGITLYNLLCIAELAQTGGEAKRLIAGNGVRINDKVIADQFYKISANDLIDGTLKLSAGKKKHVVVKINGSI